MKKTGIMLCLACILLWGCGNQTNDVATDPGESTPAATEATFDEGGNVDEDQQDTKEQAEEKQENDFTVLKVVAEDGTNLSVYLTDGYSLNSVKNDDTGEWLVKSEM
ncbi:MAG: hypothetical protein K5739_05930, partial [Lachnospiraceae bacterium]|nr:hypothetical protein [Lachnospiraceae bacterium]